MPWPFPGWNGIEHLLSKIPKIAINRTSYMELFNISERNYGFIRKLDEILIWLTKRKFIWFLNIPWKIIRRKCIRNPITKFKYYLSISKNSYVKSNISYFPKTIFLKFFFKFFSFFFTPPRLEYKMKKSSNMFEDFYHLITEMFVMQFIKTIFRTFAIHYAITRPILKENSKISSFYVKEWKVAFSREFSLRIHFNVRLNEIMSISKNNLIHCLKRRLAIWIT